jgi:hypothetical protein
LEVTKDIFDGLYAYAILSLSLIVLIEAFILRLLKFGDDGRAFLYSIAFVIVFIFLGFTKPGKRFIQEVAIFDESSSWGDSAKVLVYKQCSKYGVGHTNFDMLAKEQRDLVGCCGSRVFKSNEQDDYLSLNNRVLKYKVKDQLMECSKE